MANVEHNSLAGSALHENKGVAAATDDFVATATSGATVWKKLTASNLTTTGNSFGAQLFHLQDQKTSGTNGGTFTSGSFTKRTLNTSLTNEITSASVASSVVTLPAGTYYLEGCAKVYKVDNHKLKWRNTTDGSDTLIGHSAHAAAGSDGSNWAYVRGRFTIAGSKNFELQHRCTTTQASNGLGVASSYSVVEVFAEVMIWKVA